MSARVFLPALGAIAVAGCALDAPKADDSLTIYDFAPGTTALDMADAGDAAGTGTGGTPADWGGPDIEPVPDAAWGGLGVVLDVEGCTLWWSLVGEVVPCDDCALAFELEGESLGDECGLGVSDIAFQLEVRGGRVYGFEQDWGAATYGGGRLSWRGFSEYYTYYEYYGFIDY